MGLREVTYDMLLCSFVCCLKMSSELGVTTCVVMEVKVDCGALPYLRLTRIHARSANVVSSAEWHRWAVGGVADGPIGARCRTFGIVCKHLPHRAQEFLRGGEHCASLYSTVRFCMDLLIVPCSTVKYCTVL